MHLLATAVSAVACLQLVSALAKALTLSRVRDFIQASLQVPEVAASVLTGVGLFAEAATGIWILARPASVPLVIAIAMWVAFLLLHLRARDLEDVQCFCHGWLMGSLPARTTFALTGASALILGAGLGLSGHLLLGVSAFVAGMPVAMGVLLAFSVGPIVAPWRIRFARCSIRRSPLSRSGGAS